MRDATDTTPDDPELSMDEVSASGMFDQYSRYASCVAAVRAVLPVGGTVLDIGSGRPQLLRQFLPECEITFLDPGLDEGEEHVIVGDLSTSELDGREFDVVLCVDVLEHVPEDSRPGFLDRAVSLARFGVVLAAPFADLGGAEVVDSRLNDLYRASTGRDYPWLEEHLSFGLPDFSATQQRLRASGLTMHSFGNGHVPWLDELLGLHLLLLDDPRHVELFERVGARFARDLYRYDHLAPSYRQILVGTVDPEADVSLPQESPELRSEGELAWSAFRDWFQVELAEHIHALTRSGREFHRQLEAAGRRQQQAARQSAAEREALESRMRQRIRGLEAERDAAQRELQSLTEQLARRGVTGFLRGGLLDVARITASKIGLRGDTQWRIKSAFFTVLKPFVKHTKEYRQFAEVRAWRDREPTVDLSEVGLELEPAHETLDDVLVFGIIDWSFRIQRPQHLAREFGRLGHRVFYVAPSFLESDQPGFRIRPIDGEDRVYEVRLQVHGRPRIYDGAPTGDTHRQLAEGLRSFLLEVGLASSTAVIEHPGWTDLAALLPRSLRVYDCMDNHHGFADSGSALAAVEKRLLRDVDGLIVTSDWLEDEMRPLCEQPLGMVRNGCEPEHFESIPDASGSTPCIGYFGAIAEWFDAELVVELADAFPEHRILLVGRDTAGASALLQTRDNIETTGELSYAELPTQIAAMDVCLIPFLINDLTLATNPVKVYESLAAGRPVVATPMPELMKAEFDGLAFVAERGPEFVDAVRRALAEARDPARIEARRTFARGHSWHMRAKAFDSFVSELPKPSVTVIVIAWNSVELSRRCVRSILDDPAAPDVEVLVVDNASTDETPAWLDEIEAEPRVRVIRNAENRGFGPACNQGLEAARGDWLVILNNDLVVTRGWLRTLIGHAHRDPEIGLIGPITNNIGNEARVPTKYGSIEQMVEESAALTSLRAGKTFEIPVLAFFCVMMSREVFEAVGGLDEGFEVGFFEDDDYCRRVRAIGRRVVCAEDVFIHHELSASFKRLDQDERDRIFERNKAHFESKWGEWTPHRYRAEDSAKQTAGE